MDSNLEFHRGMYANEITITNEYISYLDSKIDSYPWILGDYILFNNQFKPN